MSLSISDHIAKEIAVANPAGDLSKEIDLLKTRKEKWEALIKGYQMGIFGYVPVQDLNDEIKIIAAKLRVVRRKLNGRNNRARHRSLGTSRRTDSTAP